MFWCARTFCQGSSSAFCLNGRPARFPFTSFITRIECCLQGCEHSLTLLFLTLSAHSVQPNPPTIPQLRLGSRRNAQKRDLLKEAVIEPEREARVKAERETTQREVARQSRERRTSSLTKLHD